MNPHCLLLLALSLTSCDDQEPVAPVADESMFLRFEQDPQTRAAALETSITSYTDDDGRRVDLIGAVHIADADYYELLNRIFQGYDHVLYEMVKPKDMPVVRDREHESAISMFQRSLTALLGVSFQLDVVDYSAENFLHADLDPTTFFRLQDEKGENLLTLMLQAAIKEWETAEDHPESQAMPLAMLLAAMSKDRGRSMKLVLGRQFAQLDRIAAGFEKSLNGAESVLLIDRNKAALAVLKERLAAGDTKLAIFYGAAHLPDMERRLNSEFGFHRSGQEWITAWDIPQGDSPVTPKDGP